MSSARSLIEKGAHSWRSFADSSLLFSLASIIWNGFLGFIIYSKSYPLALKSLIVFATVEKWIVSFLATSLFVRTGLLKSYSEP